MFLQSQELNEIFKALAAFQSEMPRIKHNKANPFFKSSYTDLSGLWEQAGKLAASHGLCITQIPATKDDGMIGVITMLGHTSGQYITSEIWMKPKDAGPQAAGSTLTYARRYGMAAALGLAGDDDDDGEAGENRDPKKTVNPKNIPTNTTKKPHPPAAAPTEKVKIFDRNDEAQVALVMPWATSVGIDAAVFPAFLDAIHGHPKKDWELIAAKFRGAL